MPAKNIIVATPNRALRARLTSIVDRMPDFRVIASTSDLMNTYNEVEERLPKAVLIGDVLANQPEFEVMHALFSTLDIRWLVVTEQLDGNWNSGQALPAKTKGSDLFAVPADAPEDIVARQLKSLTRTVSSRLPAAKRSSPFKTAAGHRHDAETAADPPAQRPPLSQRASVAGAQRPSHVTSRQGLEQAPSSRETAGNRTFGERARPLHQEPARPRQGMVKSNASSGSRSLILIGASTGGVDALLTVLENFPANCPPTLIVQHTGAGFGESLAALLNRQCRARVQLAETNRSLQNGVVTIGAGTRQHLVVEEDGAGFTLSGTAPVSGHLPSVDVMFKSAIPVAKRVSAALLTGMGRDGALGLKSLRDAGALTLAQDEKTSVVYGMPRAAAELDAADEVLPLDKIGLALLKATAATAGPRSREMLR